mmetsp:Transcript_26708/g.40545  ORF Transcript_26708/g.40545 Transcript_26708/m.40545 type:complete len:263 (+) Transcript_26708:813-1601(+)
MFPLAVHPRNLRPFLQELHRQNLLVCRHRSHLALQLIGHPQNHHPFLPGLHQAYRQVLRRVYLHVTPHLRHRLRLLALQLRILVDNLRMFHQLNQRVLPPQSLLVYHQAFHLRGRLILQLKVHPQNHRLFLQEFHRPNHQACHPPNPLLLPLKALRQSRLLFLLETHQVIQQIFLHSNHRYIHLAFHPRNHLLILRELHRLSRRLYYPPNLLISHQSCHQVAFQAPNHQMTHQEVVYQALHLLPCQVQAYLHPPGRRTFHLE